LTCDWAKATSKIHSEVEMYNDAETILCADWNRYYKAKCIIYHGASSMVHISYQFYHSVWSKARKIGSKSETLVEKTDWKLHTESIWCDTYWTHRLWQTCMCPLHNDPRKPEVIMTKDALIYSLEFVWLFSTLSYSDHDDDILREDW
jgi:hypothetical protein